MAVEKVPKSTLTPPGDTDTVRSASSKLMAIPRLSQSLGCRQFQAPALLRSKRSAEKPWYCRYRKRHGSGAAVFNPGVMLVREPWPRIVVRILKSEVAARPMRQSMSPYRCRPDNRSSSPSPGGGRTRRYRPPHFRRRRIRPVIESISMQPSCARGAMSPGLSRKIGGHPKCSSHRFPPRPPSGSRAVWNSRYRRATGRRHPNTTSPASWYRNDDHVADYIHR